MSKRRPPIGQRVIAAAREALAHAKGEPNRVIVHAPVSVDVKTIRLRQGLSQAAFARRYGVSVWSTMDACAAANPIGLFFGRLANFINGELYGRATACRIGRAGGANPKAPPACSSPSSTANPKPCAAPSKADCLGLESPHSAQAR